MASSIISKNAATPGGSSGRRSVRQSTKHTGDDETTRYTMKDVIALHQQMFQQQDAPHQQQEEERNPSNVSGGSDERTSFHNELVATRIEDGGSREHVVPESLEETVRQSSPSADQSINKQPDPSTLAQPITTARATSKNVPTLSLDSTDTLLQENKRLLDQKQELQSMIHLLSQANISEKGQYIMDSFTYRSQVEVLAEDIDFLRRKEEHLRQVLFELHLERVEVMQLQEEEEEAASTE